jgi:hypothetical protein
MNVSEDNKKKKKKFKLISRQCLLLTSLWKSHDVVRR